MGSLFRGVFLAVLACGTAAPADPPQPTLRPDEGRLYPTVSDPNDPFKMRATCSLEQRERLGLKPHTWDGVVDPEAFAALARLKETIADLEQQAQSTKDAKAVARLHSVQFRDMVFVQIQVMAQEDQRKVLGSLTAAEFRRPCLLASSPGILGYVSRSGLDKLAANPAVAGVCLDDQPIAGRFRPNIDRNALPPECEEAESPGVKEGKVDADVYRALLVTDRVRVTIELSQSAKPPQGDASDPAAAIQARQDSVASAVSADAFWFDSTKDTALLGYVTKEGVQKLWSHPDVARIAIPAARVMPPHKKQGVGPAQP